MGDNLAELLYMAWRSSLLSVTPDLPSWGNVRDPDVRAAWERVADKARSEMRKRLLGIGGDGVTLVLVRPQTDGSTAITRVSHHKGCSGSADECKCSPITTRDQHFPGAAS